MMISNRNGIYCDSLTCPHNRGCLDSALFDTLQTLQILPIWQIADVVNFSLVVRISWYMRYSCNLWRREECSDGCL